MSVTHAEVFDAVFEVVAEHGLGRAGLALVGEQVQLSEAVLRKNFGEFEQLLLRAVTFEAEKFEKHVAVYTGLLVQDLERVVTAHQDLLQRRGRVLLLLLPQLEGTAEGEALAQPILKTLVALAAVFSRYQTEGVLRLAPPLELLQGLLGPLLAADLAGRFAPTLILPFEPREYVKRFLRAYRAQ
jgi:AcrR family transcriptional regulator